jgi:NADH dehydrogenase
MPYRKICILGGSGFVGRQLAARLAAQGYRITVPTRRRERARELLVLPTVEVVEADIHDPAVLAHLFAGHAAVINLVGILHGSHKDFVRAHVKLPHKVMDACRAAGVKRLLHMSALGADPDAKSFYQHSKGEGERLVREPGREHDLEVTVFRPSVIFGPGDSFLNLFADLLRLAPVVPLANAGARFQPVHVADVARAFADSLWAAETFGQAYNLCGPSAYSLAELVALVARTLGLRRRILPLGPQASLLFAWLMEFKPGRKLMTRDNHYAMQTDNVCAEGFPARFGPPAPLEISLGYLRRDGPRDAYDRFRSAAGR